MLTEQGECPASFYRVKFSENLFLFGVQRARRGRERRRGGGAGDAPPRPWDTDTEDGNDKRNNEPPLEEHDTQAYATPFLFIYV